MHALIVTSHPLLNSRTHGVAKQLAAGAVQSAGHSVEMADLAAEGFDPCFTANDIAISLGKASPSADILSEQARIERAGALVLVFPIYWWSMPAQLKGWIDRVFTLGWAYDYDTEGDIIKKLPHKRVHLVALGASNERTYTRRGYAEAMKTQIEKGIFDYCGAPIITSHILFDSQSVSLDTCADTLQEISKAIFCTP